MIILIAFTAFIADYGLMWVGRRQAQNAADAGAMAGAIALAFDDFSDRSATGPAKVTAQSFALANLVAADAAWAVARAAQAGPLSEARRRFRPGSRRC